MNKTTFIWILLFILTSVTLFLGNSNSFSLIFIVLTLLITFFKGTLVIDYFMQLKNVKLKYRLILILWLLFVIILIGIAFLLPVKT